MQQQELLNLISQEKMRLKKLCQELNKKDKLYLTMKQFDKTRPWSDTDAVAWATWETTWHKMTKTYGLEDLMCMLYDLEMDIDEHKHRINKYTEKFNKITTKKKLRLLITKYC